MLSRMSATAGQFRQLMEYLRKRIADLKPSHQKMYQFLGDKAKLAAFGDRVIEAFKELVLLNPFVSEKRKQSSFYPKGWQPPTLAEQVTRLLDLFPSLDIPEAVIGNNNPLPKGADGLAIIPKLSALGRIFEIADPYGAGYGQIIERLCQTLHEQRSGAFENYRKGELTEAYIRLYAEVKERLMKLEAAAPSDVLVLPISFGHLYAGWSARAARWEAIDQEQLPLGGAQVSCLLLIMPERLTSHEQLRIDCSGDEYNWDAGDCWSDCLYFDFDCGRLGLDAGGAGYRDGGCGSAVAFPGVEMVR